MWRKKKREKKKGKRDERNQVTVPEPQDGENAENTVSIRQEMVSIRWKSGGKGTRGGGEVK